MKKINFYEEYEELEHRVKRLLEKSKTKEEFDYYLTDLMIRYRSFFGNFKEMEGYPKEYIKEDSPPIIGC